MSSALENLETSLENFVENMREINIIVSDFQLQSQHVFNQKIQNIVQGLQDIDKLKSHVQDIQVPLEVFDYIDEGKNPQIYTRDCIEKALIKNEEIKGKINSYRMFKAHMLSEMNEHFPNVLAKYRALRGEDKPLV